MPGSKQTILVVDDNEDVRSTTAQILNLEGFRVIEAADGEAGLERAQEERPHLIVCDIMMPKSDGFDLLAKIRANPETASIPFLFLTARAAPEDQRRGMNLGADDYLSKPFRAADLVAAIHGRLRRQRSLLATYAPIAPAAPTPLAPPEGLSEVLGKAGNGVLVRVGISNLDDVVLAMGQEVADACLSAVTDTLKSVAAGPVCYLSGRGHYCVMTQKNLAEAQDAAARILVAIRQPFPVGEQRLHLRGAVGLAAFPEHGSDPVALSAAADWAMRTAIGQGTTVEVFAPAMREAAAAGLDLSGRIRQSITAGHFELHFQPILRADGTGVSAEALIRWNHPELGMIPPFRFIPVAEANDDILPLGEWILREACERMAQFRKESGQGIGVNINLSVRQFVQDGIADLFRSILQDTGLPGSAVTLEITESVLVRNVTRTKALLDDLKSTGARIAIDDFGTGYSSLAYLNQFPLDNLKIDRSLVKDFEAENTTRTIVQSIIEMAHKLQLSVTAEGVETPEQLDILRELNSDYVQGYFFSKPLPAGQYVDYIKNSAPGS